MGIYIRLHVNPSRTTAKQWDDFYQESLLLLRQFPVPLMRLTAQQTPTGSRLVWTGAIVEQPGMPGEHWTISGDLETNLRAENFRLHRAFARQFPHRDLADKDVLWSPVEDGDDNGYELFGNKTQGYPYHLAVLAVAVLAESRFPHRAAAGGDIARHDAEEVVQWVNSILPVPVSLPVCFDLDRLYSCIEALYTDANAIQARVEELYRGPSDDLIDGCRRGSRERAALARMKKEIAGCKSLDQIGAIDLIGRFLRVTGDPARLIEFVEEANASRRTKARFPLEELFRLTYTRFSGPAQAPATPASKSSTKTQSDAWADILRNLTGQDDPGYYIAPDKLLEAFTTHAPDRRPDFERIITEVDRARRLSVQPIDDAAAGAVSRHGAGYILEQVERQRWNGVDDEELFSILGEQLGVLSGKHEAFLSADPHFYTGLLSRISGELGLPLREATWSRIDAETDVDILRRLSALAMIDNPEATFSECRKRILETPDSWPLLLRRRQSPIRATGEP